MSKIISTTAARAVYRAKQAATQLANYILGTGGRDPSAPNPFTEKPGVGGGSDCVGFVNWCWGLDRYQPGVFSEYDGWINTDSILLEAMHKGEFFEIVDKPCMGDAVVFPSVTNAKGQRIECGHIGLVVAVDQTVTNWPKLGLLSPGDRASLMSKVTIIDCDAMVSRRIAKRAIGTITADRLWNRSTARWVRYKKLAPDTVASILVNGREVQ